MLGTWLWVLLGLIGTGLLGLVVSSNGGKQRLKEWRRRLLRRALDDSGEAIRGVRPETARSRLRAEKRAQRRAQPRRLTFGRRRLEDDPTLLRRFLQWATYRAREHMSREVEKQRVAWANRRGERRRNKRGMVEILTAEWESQMVRAQGLCGSLDTEDGTPCHNPRGIEQPYCHLHNGPKTAA